MVGLPLAAPIGLSPLHVLTPCGSQRVLVVSTEPPDDLSCLTTPGVGRPRDGLLPVPLTGGRGVPRRDPQCPDHLKSMSHGGGHCFATKLLSRPLCGLGGEASLVFRPLGTGLS